MSETHAASGRSGLTIKQLEQDDLFVGDYRSLRMQLWPDCAEDCDREIEEILADVDRWAVFVALQGDSRVDGFAEAHLREFAEGAISQPVGFIEGWFVVPEARRQGVGRALIRAAEKWVLSRGCCELASDAQLDNEVSIEAHRRLGFKETERLVCFLKRLGE